MKSLNRVLMAALCTSAMTVPAYAQDTGAEEADDNVIIVTATRRAEDVQDIPIAVTAVSPVQLERQGVVDVQNITQVSPSFSTSNAQVASGSVVLRIRGVGTTSNNIGFESAVGIFVDGAYQSRPGVALSEFVDVERVEVLRGPQGTLFGRNTSAGALNITNKRPDLNEFGGFVNATYGNRDWINLQGAVNVPIIQDTLAFRLTGAFTERDGYVTVVDANGSEVGESNGQDQYLIRGQLGFETDGGISGRLIADYSKSTAGCCSAIEQLQSPLEGGIFGAVGLGLRGGQAQPNVATSPFDVSAAEQAREDRIASANFAPIADVDQWGITAEIEVPISDSADLIYVGSYRDFDSFENYDSDFTGLDLFNIDALNTEIETMTHELRIQGEAFGGRLQWLVGGYYSDEDIVSTVDASLGTQYDLFAGALFAGATAGGSITPGSPVFIGTTPLSLFGGGVSPAGTSSTNRYTQSSQSWSIFTHNVFEVTDGLKFTLGLRYSDESKDGGYEQLASNPGACNNIVSNALGAPVNGAPAIPAPFVGTTLVLGCFPFVAPADLAAAAALPLPRTFPGPLSDVGDFSDEELIWTAKLSYEFADPINIYAGFTHGYKSGGFNLDTTAAIGGADPRFDSEEVDAYEIGFKGRFLDNALTVNVAAFLEEFSNFQVLEFTGTQFQTFNVPKAESKGVEIETIIRPSDNLTFNGAVTWIDASYPGDCADASSPLRVQNLCGNPLTNAPDIVAIAGATYERDLGNYLDFFINGQIRFEDDRRTSTQASVVPTDAADLGATDLLAFDIQESNVKINLRAGIGAQDDSWALEAFVTNLTNEVTRGVTFNTTLRSGSRSTFIQQPRSFGLTLRGKF